MFKNKEVVKLVKPIIHPGTKEIIYYGTIISIKNRFNMFTNTKYTVILSDCISDNHSIYTSYSIECSSKDLSKLIKD